MSESIVHILVIINNPTQYPELIEYLNELSAN